MNKPLIEFKDVTKKFDSRVILDKINLKIYENHITTIIGKSGMGKSVLLKHIIGLLKPDAGDILFCGKDVGKMNRKERESYRSKISYMFQNNALFDSLTVFENIALPLRQTTNLGNKEIEKRVMARIEQTELSEVAYKYPSELSGGMQKRTALARALVTDPSIVLFDEPTTGQDPVRKYAILSMISEYKKNFGFTAILISHEIPDVFFISNRILVLNNGKIVFQGTPEELGNFKHEFMDEFVSSLEGFQDELTGLYSKQVFRAHYNSDLKRKHPEETFTVVLFSVDLDKLNSKLGHTAAHEVLKTLGLRIDRELGTMGLSARHGRDEIVTVLPFADLKEAEQMVTDFAMELQEERIHELQVNNHSNGCIEFSIFAGIAEGTSKDEIDDIIEKAHSKEKAIARFLCKR